MTSDRDLDTAYRQTVYRVHRPDVPVDFCVDEHSPALQELLRSYASDSAAFLTAHNPGSRLMSQMHNCNAQAALEAQARGMGATALPGVALDPQGAWPAEDSLLLVNIDREAACNLGRRFGQNALVWIDQTGLPELVWLT
ncbi:MAG: DUF3293 domain-containing protein [Gammaproteobacteria bacterium]|nr:DUF3293 domain-containing protein [Gammaproteobacteria bacterium]